MQTANANAERAKTTLNENRADATPAEDPARTAMPKQDSTTHTHAHRTKITTRTQRATEGTENGRDEARQTKSLQSASHRDRPRPPLTTK